MPAILLPALRLLALLALVAAPAAVAAASPDPAAVPAASPDPAAAPSAAPDPAAPGSTTALADPAAFPVEIHHALGTTVIPAPPQRIVTLGWSGEDAVFALGQVPLAMPRYANTPSGILPWNAEAARGADITLMPPGPIDFEAVAALRPDLILAIRSGVDALAWARLSAIAPTVVYRSAPWTAGWQEQALMTGAALGQPARAAALVEQTEAFLRRLGQDNPQLAGRSFVFGAYFPGAAGLVLYLPADPRVAALQALGLKPAPLVAALGAANPGRFSAQLSFERLDQLEADLLIMWYAAGSRAALEAQPMFGLVPAVARGSYVALEEGAAVWATSALSLRSIPYGFPAFVPQLAAAAAHLPPPAPQETR